MIDYTVLGGYLGAGKTTLLNHILRNNDGHRIALLVNDFGDINIDTQLIQSRGENQINLANGCVCCSLSDGFFEALDTLQNLDPPPTHIIVEASGVANVGNLSQYGYGREMRLAAVIVVADAETVREKAHDKYVAQTVRRQLAAADLIILNKVDLCSDERRPVLEAWLTQETGGTPVISAVRCEVPLSMLLATEPSVRTRLPEHRHHEAFRSWSFTAERSVTKEDLEAFLRSLGPEIIRAKGLFARTGGGVLELQLVGRRKELIERDGNRRGSCEMVAIGRAEQLDPEHLDALAGTHLRSH